MAFAGAIGFTAAGVVYFALEAILGSKIPDDDALVAAASNRVMTSISPSIAGEVARFAADHPDYRDAIRDQSISYLEENFAEIVIGELQNNAEISDRLTSILIGHIGEADALQAAIVSDLHNLSEMPGISPERQTQILSLMWMFEPSRDNLRDQLTRRLTSWQDIHPELARAVLQSYRASINYDDDEDNVNIILDHVRDNEIRIESRVYTDFLSIFHDSRHVSAVADWIEDPDLPLRARDIGLRALANLANDTPAEVISSLVGMAIDPEEEYTRRLGFLGISMLARDLQIGVTERRNALSRLLHFLKDMERNDNIRNNIPADAATFTVAQLKLALESREKERFVQTFFRHGIYDQEWIDNIWGFLIFGLETDRLNEDEIDLFLKLEIEGAQQIYIGGVSWNTILAALENVMRLDENEDDFDTALEEHDSMGAGVGIASNRVALISLSSWLNRLNNDLTTADENLERLIQDSARELVVHLLNLKGTLHSDEYSNMVHDFVGLGGHDAARYFIENFVDAHGFRPDGEDPSEAAALPLAIALRHDRDTDGSDMAATLALLESLFGTAGPDPLIDRIIIRAAHLVYGPTDELPEADIATQGDLGFADFRRLADALLLEHADRSPPAQPRRLAATYLMRILLSRQGIYAQGRGLQSSVLSAFAATNLYARLAAIATVTHGSPDLEGQLDVLLRQLTEELSWLGNLEPDTPDTPWDGQNGTRIVVQPALAQAARGSHLVVPIDRLPAENRIMSLNPVFEEALLVESDPPSVCGHWRPADHDFLYYSRCEQNAVNLVLFGEEIGNINEAAHIRFLEPQPERQELAVPVAIGQTIRGEYEAGAEFWLTFETEPGNQYFIETFNLSSNTDTIIEVYDREGGEDPVAENDDHEDDHEDLASRVQIFSPHRTRFDVLVRGYDDERDGQFSVIVDELTEDPTP